MSSLTVAPGCVFHWEGFRFEDGEQADKYLVFVGAKTGSNYLAVIATSQPKKRDFKPGCNAAQGYYHIPGGKDGFKKDTWLLLAPPREISPAEFLKFAMKREIKLVVQLRHDIANAICNCMRQCEDVSEYHRSLLGPVAEPPKQT